jgi:hypothetical protein
MAETKQKYKVRCWGACIKGVTRCGIQPPGGKRYEEGDVVEDLPPGSIRELLALGCIEPVEDAPEPKGGDS